MLHDSIKIEHHCVQCALNTPNTALHLLNSLILHWKVTYISKSQQLWMKDV